LKSKRSLPEVSFVSGHRLSGAVQAVISARLQALWSVISITRLFSLRHYPGLAATNSNFPVNSLEPKDTPLGFPNHSIPKFSGRAG
jgi:hypothetical protein